MTRVSAGRAALAAALLAVACAHIEPPTGGPEDETPPELLVTRPDSLVVRPDWRGPVVLVFDERISERGARESVTVSPRTSPVVVEHDGDEIRVSLREGWRPGVVYHIVLAPPLQDLFDNVRTAPARLIFSTGAAIPDTRLKGTVVDVITGKPEIGARVEAVRAPDSLGYVVLTDSAGGFDLSRVPEGEYVVRVYRDMNRSRALDPFEPRDTTVVTLAATAPATAEFAVLEPDTTGPAVAKVERAEGRIVVTFDDFLDPTQTLRPAQIQIRGAGGELVRVTDATVGEPPAQRDTASGRGARGRRRAAADTAAADTASVRPLPSRDLVLILAEGAEVEEGVEYRLRIRGLRNVAGLAVDIEHTFTPAARAGRRAPAADTTAVEPDSIRPDLVPPDTVPPDTAARVRPSTEPVP